MPHKSGSKGVDLDRAGAVNDNRPDLIQRAKQGGAKAGKDGFVHGAAKSLKHSNDHYPQATSMLGSLNIIQNPGHGKDKAHGIPGILSTTTLGPEQRNRLVSGIIDLAAAGHHESGPVHAVSGHDATAMNAGMRPIPGAVIHGDRHSSGAKHSKHY